MLRIRVLMDAPPDVDSMDEIVIIEEVEITGDQNMPEEGLEQVKNKLKPTNNGLTIKTVKNDVASTFADDMNDTKELELHIIIKGSKFLGDNKTVRMGLKGRNGLKEFALPAKDGMMKTERLSNVFGNIETMFTVFDAEATKNFNAGKYKDMMEFMLDKVINTENDEDDDDD